MDNKVDFFSKEYSEDNWINFSKCFSNCKINNDVLKDVPQDVINALNVLIGYENIEKWLQGTLKALDNKSPIELCKEDKSLRALRAFILRMPN